MIDLVISGGQSGADLAGNEWARQNHLPAGPMKESTLLGW